MASPVVDAANEYRAQLANRELASIERLLRAYADVYTAINDEMQKLLDRIADAGGVISPGQRISKAQLARLKKQVVAEIDRYAVIADNELSEISRDAIASALADSQALVQLALPEMLRDAGIMASWRQLPTGAITEMLGFLQPNSPLRQSLLTELGAVVADRFADALIKGVALGWNPRRIAAETTKQLGVGLTWSLRTVRTAQLWSYRSATQIEYAANPKTVKGWIWSSALDNRTCMGCIAMHGTKHPSTEILNDHHNGRCCMIPDVIGYADLGLDVPDEPIDVGDGRAWFDSQSDAIQRQMMGPGLWQAWKDGQVPWEKLVSEYDDPVYGVMRRQSTLKEALDVTQQV